MLFSANLKFLFPSIPSILDKYIAAHNAGFKGVECGNVYESSIEDLIEIQKQTNLQQVLLNIVTKDDSVGCAACPDHVEQFKQDLELSIEYCNALKCKKLHILAGKLPLDSYNVEGVTKAWRDTFIKNLYYASKRVSKDDITLLIEPISAIPLYFLNKTDQALGILKDLGCSNVKLQLDFFHHQRTHGNIVNTLKEYVPQIGHVQIAQVPGRHEPDMKGEINYHFVFQQLYECGYDGWVGCEYNPLDEGNFDWMKMYEGV